MSHSIRTLSHLGEQDFSREILLEVRIGMPISNHVASKVFRRSRYLRESSLVENFCCVRASHQRKLGARERFSSVENLGTSTTLLHIGGRERRGRLAINSGALFMRRPSNAGVLLRERRSEKVAQLPIRGPAIISEQRCIKRNENINWRVLDGFLLTREFLLRGQKKLSLSLSLSLHWFLPAWCIAPLRIIFNLGSCIAAIVEKTFTAFANLLAARDFVLADYHAKITCLYTCSLSSLLLLFVTIIISLQILNRILRISWINTKYIFVYFALEFYEPVHFEPIRPRFVKLQHHV